MERNIVKKHVLAFSMLTLFAMYFVGVNCSTHVHVINGVTIAHSHLHGSSHHAQPDGKHCTCQLNLIATACSQFVFADSTPILDDTSVYYLLETIAVERNCWIYQTHSINFAWRAPPMSENLI